MYFYRSSVVRWHSFQNGERPDWCKVTIKTPDFKHVDTGISLASMSCGQLQVSFHRTFASNLTRELQWHLKLQVVRKLALVTLTGYMERYCPSHRSGWNWELGGVTKFIKKIKAPDYKG